MRIRFQYCILGTAMLAAPVSASDMTISIEVPRLRVAEYHNPYVAVWVADANNRKIADLAVWYDTKLRNQEGEKWLPDLRTWWRRSGRALNLPIDGLSSPTRAPGRHALRFTDGRGRLPRMKAGSYTLMVEAAREVGGREVLAVPFVWPPKGTKTTSAQGKAELGKVIVTVKP
ncbi:MAG: DUF2271 domain-containing protein [Sphingomonadaceae bacterium]